MIDWDKFVLAPLAAVFGEPALYTPASGAAFSIVGVFDEAHSELESIGDGTAMHIEVPVFGVRMAQFAQAGRLPLQGDQLTITRTATTYVVRDVQNDGHGQAKLLLNYVSS